MRNTDLYTTSATNNILEMEVSHPTKTLILYHSCIWMNCFKFSQKLSGQVVFEMIENDLLKNDSPPTKPHHLKSMDMHLSSGVLQGPKA